MLTHSKSETMRRTLSSNMLRAALTLTLFVFVALSLSVTTLAARLQLVDGTSIEVDEAWEDAQGVWYRCGGVTHLVERGRVKSIERDAPAAQVDAPNKSNTKATVKVVESEAATRATVAPVESVWIHLVGGARVEADEASEDAGGVWYRRGNLSIFIERARIERVERETAKATETETAVAASLAPSKRRWRERGWSTGSSRLDALIRQNGVRYGVDPYLVFCVMEQESHFSSGAVSPKGARGLMQLMPGTAARFGVRRPHDAAQNIAGGTRYLKELLRRFNGRVELVLASYNAGEGAVMKYGHRVPPYRETRNYVRRISARYQRGA